MKTNFWYSARENELFIDMDNFQSMRHFRARLKAATDSCKFSVKDLMIFNSASRSHKHIIILLDNPMPPLDRYVWEIVLRSDVYRGCCNIMRYIYNVPNPDILICPVRLHRMEDAICYCEEKHSLSVMEKCPAAITLRGNWRTAAFFGKTRKT